MEETDWLLQELRDFVNESLLTAAQLEIFEARLNKESYLQIQERFHISGPTALVHCLHRTASGLPWWSGMDGGADGYLCPGDEKRFKEYISIACDEVNCLTAHTAMSLAFNMAKVRAGRARKLLHAIGCSKLALRVPEPEAPSRPWVNSVCESIDVKICRGQELEIARRIYCDYDAIAAWFLRFEVMFQRSPLLIFNMDETYITAKRTLHRLAPKERQPLVTSLPFAPHMTGAVTINAAGQTIKPFVILSKKKTMRSLEQFTDSVYLASSTSGWMTKSLFRFFAMSFIADISHLRAQWPKEIRDEPILLLCDGHASRWDFKANLLFYLFNIDVLTYPGHCSHLLQAFDVAVANPLKTAYKRLLTELAFGSFCEDFAVANLSTSQKRTMKNLRSSMIECFISACQIACSRQNSRSGFAATGVSPYDPMRPLSNQYVMEPPRDVFPRRSGKANSQFLTSEEALAAMFLEENGREMTPEDCRVSIHELFEEMKAAGLDRGIPLTPAPDVLIRLSDETYRLVNMTEL